jgi:dipeptidyl aminopeptidase/acylaminoacyl peptidase
MDLDADEYVRRIWLWDGTTTRPLTSGPADGKPRWSPDGAKLAFIRKGQADDAKPQLALLPASGGEAETITDFDLGVSDVVWSPDGTRLAVVATEWHGAWADLTDEERKRRPRRITHLAYRGDNRGWLHDRRSHLWLVDPAGREPLCLTPGDFDESGPAWHPDGSRLAFTSARHDARRVDPGNQIWEVPASGGEAVAVSDVGGWGSVSYDPSGTLHALGQPGQWDWPASVLLYRFDEGTPKVVVSDLDRSLDSSPPMAPSNPQWLEDSSALTGVEDSGRVRVIKIAPDGAITEVVGGDRVVGGFSARPDGAAVAFVAKTPTNPGELYWLEAGEERRLSNLNEAFVAATTLAEPQRFAFDMDGTEIEGWVYLPAGEQ